MISMGSTRLGKQRTLALMIALKCLDQTPGIDGRVAVQLDIQVNHDETPAPFWVPTVISGIADKYYIQGEFDWNNLDRGGECEVSQVTTRVEGEAAPLQFDDGKTYTTHIFRWQLVDDRLEVNLIETRVV
jgi:hypothetical protein